MTIASTATLTSKEGISKIHSLMNSLGLVNSDLKSLQKHGLISDILVVPVPLKSESDISRARKILALFF